MLDNLTIPIEYSTKIFFKEYPYRIKYLTRMSNRDSRKWLSDSERAELDVFERNGIFKSPNAFKLMMDKIAFNSKPRMNCHDKSRSVLCYFENEEDFLKAQGINSTWIMELTVPALENLSEVTNNLGSTEELRKTLYWRKYRHKLDLKNSDDFRKNSVVELGDRLTEMEGVRMNSGLQRVYHGEKNQNYPMRGWRYRWESMSIAFENENDAAFIALLYGDNINSWKTAKLISEAS
jgi:hypothetical protein